MTFVQLPPDGTGKKISTIPVGDEQLQIVALADDQGAPINSANPVPVAIQGSIPVTIATAIEITNDDGNAIPISSAALTSIETYFKAEDSASVSGDKGLPLLAIRQLADTTSTDTDGDYTLLKIDEEGRLKVSSKPASYPDITGDITAIQATIGTPVAGGTVSGDVSRASNIMAFCTGTFSTVNCTFEGSLEASGDTNWFAIQAVRSNANTIETTTGNLSAQPAYAWEMSVNALKRVRVRATARTSGTQSWRFVQGTYATEPIPAAQVSATQPVSGTVALGASSAIAGAFQRALGTSTNGLTTFHHLISAANTNLTSVKAGAGAIANIELTNNSASMKFFKLYNKASAPVLASDTPIMTLGIPANGSRSFTPPIEWRLATGIAYAITGAIAVTDATAVAAGDVAVSIGYA